MTTTTRTGMHIAQIRAGKSYQCIHNGHTYIYQVQRIEGDDVFYKMLTAPKGDVGKVEVGQVCKGELADFCQRVTDFAGAPKLRCNTRRVIAPS